jgi:hypothetical protein
MSAQQFELVLTAEAEVVRGCCGGNHEYGECPLDQQQAAAPPNQPVDETDEGDE